MNSKLINKKVKLMFPEHRELVAVLKEQEPHFAKLFEEHDVLNKKIAQLELDPINRNIYDDIELLKRQKLKIKDELYAILKKHCKEH